MLAVEDVNRWSLEVQTVTEKIAARFSRKDLRQHAGRYLQGLISRIERKNNWQMAEELGEKSPTNLQHFIARASWSADEVRDDLQQYVCQQLGDKNGILIVDETGFLKKGTKSVGVKRQYSGTAGRIENCQIGVFLAYRSRFGQALIDRSLYLPQEWAEDSERRKSAQVPADVEFATKPQQAREMLSRALTSGLPCQWVTADEAYGSDHKFRLFCEENQLHYVVAITSQTHLYWNGQRSRVSQHAAQFSPKMWRQLSCGTGSKGERLYEWASISWPHHEQEKKSRGFLVRRSLSDPAELAYYFTYCPSRTPLQRLVEVAGSRWAIEECFEQAKQKTGLDEYEVRSWHGWHRHITLSLLAHATLSVIRSQNSAQHHSKKVSIL